jgi:hypothetical protein
MRHLLSSSRSPGALGALLAAAATLVAMPARADGDKLCGNGYCDAWAGEDARTCPADCTTAAPAAPPGAAYPPGVYPPGMYQPGMPPPGMYPPGMYPPGMYPPGMYPPGMYPREPGLARKWKVGDPPPPGFHVEQRPIQGLLIGGGVTLGAAWIASMALGVSSHNDGGGYSAIPIVGSFIAAGVYKAPTCNSFCYLDFGPAFYKAFLITFGAIQTTGAAILIAGVTVRRDKLIPGPGLTLTPVPMVGPTGSGLGLHGTF